MTDRKKLNLGYSDFKNIIKSNSYFVDKSLLIKEVIDTEKNVLLFPRPRRFGKTLNLSMLKCFFDKNEPENKTLFKDLKIWQTEDYIKENCGKYPVINLSFKDAKANNWNDCYELIISEIVKLYSKHDYLLENNTLKSHEKNNFKNILTENASNVKYQNSIKQLSEYLERSHKEKIVILIDEYDTPIQAGYGKFYDEVVPFMRNLLSGAFKDNSNLYKGIISGILRVSKESIFSGLNNLSVYSILDNQFSDKFGFTEPEVNEIIKDFKVKTEYSKIKKWYNGYRFGKVKNIYNPWSILNYVLHPEDGFKTFWTNTSANELIKNEIKKKEADSIRKEILKLINNETINKDIEENFVFPDLSKRKSILWTLLTYSGYLTTKKQISRKEYELFIPNYEIKTIFQDTIIEWLETDIKIIKSLLQDTTNYLINNQLTDFEKGFKEIIGDTFSYYDTAKNNEYIYHSYILGLLAIIGDDYLIKSNKESGEGRYDIMLIPHDTSTSLSTGKSRNGVVIEIKQIEKQQAKEKNEDFNKRINKEIKFATNQIDKNKYYKELIDNKVDETNIIKIPIVFAGKEPYITLIEKDY
ncbi:MAG: AAA family ATPase [Bacteroidota bacterium]|nr:AAA family ATPase [Bacteroidota bacterium]